MVDNVFGNETTELHGKSEILSRRKRFLVFPEGSSLQLVFCNSFPLVSAIGDIMLWGYTAALAYELPQDPYSPFMHHADPLHRRVDTKEIYYMNENGKIIYKRPYKKKFIVNPAFAKRSVDSPKTRGDAFKIDRIQMHRLRSEREFLKSVHMDRGSVEFHRRSRSLLYQKIETMLQSSGVGGRRCMLKTLCLVGQTQDNPQGSFLQEILRSVFTLPKGHSSDPEYKEYDDAMSAKESCDVLYPECNEPVQDAVPNVLI
ncbi:uncharacterized protein LOC126370793 [Pectinophora gossypiella]|uniref:uncharacterized protein LOC126370793 n=1 Tax=Pectinophora gossypiella TaxID=13191 RepID=UPI00214F130E|nr:uncharacterized protein LOC126370793 [Pectinophora gossypiella]